MRLKGQVALITGGGAGIGAKIAERFVAEGAKVCICDLQQEALGRILASLPEGTAVASHGDVAKPGDVREMIRTAVEFGGKLDILVNNAGTDGRRGGNVIDMDLETWQRVFDTNVTGPFLTTKGAIPKMIEAGGGAIVNISSLAGLRCLPNLPAYCTSKGALIMLTQQVALDFGPSKVRCNAICPGPVRTGLLDTVMIKFAQASDRDVDDVFEQLTENVPLRRTATPEEIAAACVFLASDEASFVNGTVLVVDGGLATVDAMGVTLRQMRTAAD